MGPRINNTTKYLTDDRGYLTQQGLDYDQILGLKSFGGLNELDSNILDVGTPAEIDQYILDAKALGWDGMDDPSILGIGLDDIGTGLGLAGSTLGIVSAIQGIGLNNDKADLYKQQIDNNKTIMQNQKDKISGLNSMKFKSSHKQDTPTGSSSPTSAPTPQQYSTQQKKKKPSGLGMSSGTYGI